MYCYCGVLENDEELSSDVKFVLDGFSDDDGLTAVTPEELRLLVAFNAVSDLCLFDDAVHKWYKDYDGYYESKFHVESLFSVVGEDEPQHSVIFEESVYHMDSSSGKIYKYYCGSVYPEYVVRVKIARDFLRKMREVGICIELPYSVEEARLKLIHGAKWNNSYRATSILSQLEKDKRFVRDIHLGKFSFVYD